MPWLPAMAWFRSATLRSSMGSESRSWMNSSFSFSTSSPSFRKAKFGVVPTSSPCSIRRRYSRKASSPSPAQTPSTWARRAVCSGFMIAWMPPTRYGTSGFHALAAAPTGSMSGASQLRHENPTTSGRKARSWRPIRRRSRFRSMWSAPTRYPRSFR